MSLDILNPSILNEEKSIGGFCLIDISEIDNINYFEVDDTKIGVDLSYINSLGNSLVCAVKLAVR